MLAAVLHEKGTELALEQFPDPGEARLDGVVIDVVAAGVNPVDLVIAKGIFPLLGELPAVVGLEGVGRTEDGRLVYFDRSEGSFGSFAEQTVVAPDTLIELPEEIDAGLATAFGIAGLAAWCSMSWRGELKAGETVIVLGASGVLGRVAVQGAKLLGAGRVVAAARDADALSELEGLGADATVNLGEHEGDALTRAFKEAAGGDGADLVVDPLWGAPAMATLGALRRGGRLMQIGNSAGVEAMLSPSSFRNRHIDIRGYTNFLLPREVKSDAYRTMVRHAAAGELTVPVQSYALDDALAAWDRQINGSPHEKLVIRP